MKCFLLMEVDIVEYLTSPKGIYMLLILISFLIGLTTFFVQSRNKGKSFFKQNVNNNDNLFKNNQDDNNHL